jgi:hypothetical protein
MESMDQRKSSDDSSDPLGDTTGEMQPEDQHPFEGCPCGEKGECGYGDEGFVADDAKNSVDEKGNNVAPACEGLNRPLGQRYTLSAQPGSVRYHPDPLHMASCATPIQNNFKKSWPLS